MVNYKSLGLVNTREMFKRAINGGWAVPAFNFNNLEQLQAIIKATSELKSPVILQVSKGARNYANQTLLRYMAEGAVEYAKELGCNHPEIALHLDHGDSFELCKNCVDMGFSSVMIDGSSLPYDENVALTKQVVDYAHQYDVTVEGELGVLAGVEDEVASEVSHYTKPEEVIDFTTKTGVDSLAISIGTSHGAYKFKPEQCTRDPKTGSTSTAASCPTLSEYPRSSCARQPTALSARLTLTPTLALPSPQQCARLWPKSPQSLTRASTADRLATSWRKCTSTRFSTCSAATTSWHSSTDTCNGAMPHCHKEAEHHCSGVPPLLFRVG